MSELIEKVARAISEGDWDQAPDGRAGQRLMQNRDGTFRDINMPSRDEYCDTARAAILAVAEWLAQSEDRECYPLETLRAELERHRKETT